MKLKTFDKCNVAVVTEYTVFRGDECVDWFTEDYCKTEGDNVRKKLAYIEKGADVRFVAVNSVTGHLRVSLSIKEEEND